MRVLFKQACVFALGVMATASVAVAQHTTPPVANNTTNEVTAQIRADNAVTIAQTISNRFNPMHNAFDVTGAPGSDGQSGLASGDEASGWSVWGSVANSWNRNTFTATRSDSVSQTVTVGADRALGDRMTVGASLTYTHNDTDTIYNSGTNESHGFSFVPYMSVQLTDWLTADASLGYTYSDSDQNIAGVTSNYDTQGFIGTVNLNAAKWYGSWLTSAKAGLMVNSNKRATYTDSFGTVYQSSTDNLTQASVDLSVGYWMEPMMPYVAVGYAYDLSSEDPTTPGASDDKDEFRLSAGAHIYGTGAWQNVTGGFSVSTVVGREDKENTTAGLNLRVAF